RRIGEAGQLDLAERLELLAVEALDESRRIDDELGESGRNDHRRIDQVAVGGREVALGVELEAARAGIGGGLVGQQDAEESFALDGEVELPLRGLELALVEELFGRLEADAAAGEVGERGAAALVAGELGAGDVRGDEVDLL